MRLWKSLPTASASFTEIILLNETSFGSITKRLLQSIAAVSKDDLESPKAMDNVFVI